MKKASKIRYHLIAVGRVQGVGYRNFCERIGQSLNLLGWVKNSPDGSVEIEVQGTKTLVEQFIDKIKKGPMLAHVSNLSKSRLDLRSGDSSFVIRY